MQLSGATPFNLSVLTSDMWRVISKIFLPPEGRLAVLPFFFNSGCWACPILVAHVGDFGLAKIEHGTVIDDFSKGQSSSFAVKGTVGYVPPEHGMGGRVLTQGDVYSYGILLLEMITGKKPTDVMFKDGINLHTLCSSAISESSLMKILDVQLLEEMDIDLDNIGKEGHAEQTFQDCVMAVTELGIACSVENPYLRIGTGHALRELHKIKEKLFKLNHQKKKVPPFPHEDNPSSS